MRVPYASEFVKGAPSIDADATISDEEESEIYRYYQGSGTTGQTSVEGTVASAGTAIKNTAAATGAALGLSASSKTTGTADTASTVTGKDHIEVALTEEQVKIGKRTVDAGGVRLRKIVRTEIVNQPVEIRHEDVVVERVSADQVRAGTATSDFTEQTIDVPLTCEEVVVRKEDVEVVRDGKTVTESTEFRKS